MFTLGNEFCKPTGDRLAPGRSSNLHFMTCDKSHFDCGRRTPLLNGGEYADDAVLMYTHGTTHVDALGHFWRGDRLYK